MKKGLKLFEIFNEDPFINQQEKPKDQICLGLLYKAHESLENALRHIENAYQHCEEEEWKQQMIDWKNSLTHDFGHSDSDGIGMEKKDDDYLLNSIANFIDKNSYKNYSTGDDETLSLSKPDDL